MEAIMQCVAWPRLQSPAHYIVHQRCEIGTVWTQVYGILSKLLSLGWEEKKKTLVGKD